MKSALIITDMQVDLVNYIKDKKRINEVINNIQKVSDIFRQKNLPVIYLKFVNTPNNKHIKRFKWDYCLKGTGGSQIIDELKPKKSDLVFEKEENSGFYNQEFVDTLKKLNIHTLILTGIQTHICILSTANDGYAHNYDVIVLKDCVTSSSEKKKKLALEWIDNYAGKVISSNNLVL